MAWTLRTGTSLAARSLKTSSIHNASSEGGKLVCLLFARPLLPFIEGSSPEGGKGHGTVVFEARHSSREWVRTVFLGGGVLRSALLCSVIKHTQEVGPSLPINNRS